MPNLLPANFFNGSLPIALVAGGAGFVGSHVCAALLEKNVKVICLDNWQTGVKENIKEFSDNKNFCLLERDITKRIPKEIERLDYVLQLAAVEGYTNGEDVSIETLEANSVGTKNLLDLSIKHNARFLLASTVYVYSGKISSTSTLNYFGKYEENKLSHNEAKRFAEALTGEYGQKKSLDARIVRMGDVYGPRMSLGTNNTLSKLFKQATYRDQLVLPGRGESKLYPIYIGDVTQGVIKVLFSSGLKNSVISLSGEKKSLLEVARVVREIGLIQQDIVVDPSIKTTDASNDVQALIEKERGEQAETFSWQPKTELSQGVQLTLQWLYSNISLAQNVGQKQEPVVQEANKIPEPNFWEEPKRIEFTQVEEVKSTKHPQTGFFSELKIKKPKGGKYTAIISALVIGFLFWFFVLPFIQFGVGLFELSMAKTSLLKTDTDRARIWSVGAGQWFSAGQGGFANWANVPLLKSMGTRLANKNRLLQDVAGISADIAGVLGDGRELFSGLTGQDSYDSRTSTQKIALGLKSLENKIGFLQAEVGDSEVSVSVPFIKKYVVLQEGDLINARRAATGLASLIENSPDLLGQDSKKTYLLLLQDESELRPAGGVVTGYGLITFERGHLTNVEIQDTQVADSQLKGQVDPPDSLRQYLSQDNWKLKDSSWNPDFPTTAARAAWFIDKELGQKVNGVIAIDATYFKNVLKRTGPLDISKNGKTIAFGDIDKKILEGKGKGTNYLTDLTRGLATMFVEQQQKTLGGFVRGSVDSLTQKHLLIWTDNTAANNALTRAGWDGSVRKISCPQTTTGGKECLPDYLQIVEANVGGNYANLLVDRSYSLEATIDKAKTTHRLTISYKNTSKQDVSGDYKNFIRLYVNTKSKLVLASLIDKEGKQENLNVDTSQEQDKAVFGTLINVPSNTTEDTVFIWETENPKQVEDGGSLVFFWQKQPGTFSDPVSLRITLPDDQAYKYNVYPDASLTDDNLIGYNTNLSRDILANITWQPK